MPGGIRIGNGTIPGNWEAHGRHLTLFFNVIVADRNTKKPRLC